MLSFKIESSCITVTPITHNRFVSQNLLDAIKKSVLPIPTLHRMTTFFVILTVEKNIDCWQLLVMHCHSETMARCFFTLVLGYALLTRQGLSGGKKGKQRSFQIISNQLVKLAIVIHNFTFSWSYRVSCFFSFDQANSFNVNRKRWVLP